VLNTLRAFGWMRWRVLINSLERTGARDTLERLSLAVEQIGPIVALALFAPSALALAGLAGYSGVALARSSEVPITLEILRFLMLAAVALTLVGPFLLPAGERTNATRLLLLPIPRTVLYVAQAGSALADPWILLTVPVIVVLPIGLALGGLVGTSLIAFVAGVLFVIALVGLSSLGTAVIHLLVRDRRRGELLALLFIVVLPALSIIPGAIHDDDRRSSRSERDVRRDQALAEWLRESGATALSLMPSELYRTALVSARENVVSAARPAAALALAGVILHGLGLIAFGRLLDSPGSSSRRRAAGNLSRRSVTIPGVSPGASAVAVSQVRLALRTPRGRSILLSPLAVFVMFSILMRRGSNQMEFGFVNLDGGLSLAVFSSAVCLLSILPFAVNQFAIDRAGLTLQLLSPLRDRDILIGKAIGNGVIAGMPAAVCVALAFAIFQTGSPAMWLSVPLGLAATYVLTTPVSAALSALLPRAVDLNSIGRRSNAHGVANLLGMLAFLVGAAPPLLLVFLARSVLGRPALAPLLLLIWGGAALLLARVLLVPASRLFRQRRENLGMVG
jgi:hypothetical protein